MHECSSIIKFAEQCLSPEMRASVFSPRLVEVCQSTLYYVNLFVMLIGSSTSYIHKVLLDIQSEYVAFVIFLLYFSGRNNYQNLIHDLNLTIQTPK